LWKRRFSLDDAGKGWGREKINFWRDDSLQKMGEIVVGEGNLFSREAVLFE